MHFDNVGRLTRDRFDIKVIKTEGAEAEMSSLVVPRIG